MKAFINIALVGLLLFTFGSCTKKEVAKEAEVTIKFDLAVDQAELEANSPFDYTNKAGNKYNVSALGFDVTDVVLIDEGFNEIPLNNTTNEIGLTGGQLSGVSLPNGTYKTLRLTVSSFVHKGKFLDGSNAEQNIDIDFSGGGAEQTIEVPVGGLTVNGVAKTAYVSFNLNEVYDAGTDFNAGATQAEVIPTFNSAFSFAGSYENK